MKRINKDRFHYTLLFIAILCIVIPKINNRAIEQVKAPIDITRPITCDILLKCTQINDSTVIVIKSSGFSTKDLIKFRNL